MPDPGVCPSPVRQGEERQANDYWDYRIRRPKLSQLLKATALTPEEKNTACATFEGELDMAS